MDIKRNSSTDCYSFMNNSYELIINLSVYGATTSIGAVSALTAIVLILVAKGYKEFVYRLILYMALDFVLGYPFMLTWRILVDSYQLNYIVINTLLNTMMNYAVYVYLFLLCWLGLYLFLLAVFRVQLKKTKHEAIGLVTVLVTPLTFLWVFPWKVRNTLCEASYSLEQIKLVIYYNIPNISSILLSCAFIGAVLITLCRSARKQDTLQQQHRRAVRETIPLVVFMITHQVAVLINASVLAYQLYMAQSGKRVSFLLWEFFDLWPLVGVSLPILLLSQPRIRRSIKCCLTRSQQHDQQTNYEYPKTSPQSSCFQQTSRTYFSVPYETCESYVHSPSDLVEEQQTCSRGSYVCITNSEAPINTDYAQEPSEATCLLSPSRN